MCSGSGWAVGGCWPFSCLGGVNFSLFCGFASLTFASLPSSIYGEGSWCVVGCALAGEGGLPKPDWALGLGLWRRFVPVCFSASPAQQVQPVVRKLGVVVPFVFRRSSTCSVSTVSSVGQSEFGAWWVGGSGRFSLFGQGLRLFRRATSAPHRALPQHALLQVLYYSGPVGLGRHLLPCGPRSGAQS